MTTLRTVASVLLVGALTIAATLLIGGGTANAFARGCAFWNGVDVKGHSVGTSQYCAQVDGKGAQVDDVEGDFHSIANVCNYQLTAEFFNQNWTWVRTFTTVQMLSCTHENKAVIPIHKSIKALTGTEAGYLCSTLRQGGQRTTSVCHFVHA